MSDGFFFPESEALERKPLSLIPKCGACGLFKSCKTPYMKFSGKGKKGIAIIGEAPGSDEDEKGRQFVGKTGRRLRDTLSKYGVNMIEDCFLFNALSCRPPRNYIKNEMMVEWCRPNVVKFIDETQPSTIILLGARSIKSVIGGFWRDDVGGISKWAGFQVPSHRPNAWICPTFHPSYVIREEERRNTVAAIWWERHLEAAVNLVGRPWTDDKVRDRTNEIKIILNPQQAAKSIRLMACFNRPIAFDYETNMLKPDSDQARIVSCSLSDGKTTIAFPWHGNEVKEAMKAFLLSPCPKIAANLKFEHRWSLAKLGVNVRNWKRCTMITSHIMDNRPGITGLKFQSYVNFGQDDYDYHIKPFLESEYPNDRNRIRDIGIEDLLKYNGMDALLEWELEEKQDEMMRSISDQKTQM